MFCAAVVVAGKTATVPGAVPGPDPALTTGVGVWAATVAGAVPGPDPAWTTGVVVWAATVAGAVPGTEPAWTTGAGDWVLGCGAAFVEFAATSRGASGS